MNDVKKYHARFPVDEARRMYMSLSSGRLTLCIGESDDVIEPATPDPDPHPEARPAHPERHTHRGRNRRPGPRRPRGSTDRTGSCCDDVVGVFDQLLIS